MRVVDGTARQRAAERRRLMDVIDGLWIDWLAGDRHRDGVPIEDLIETAARQLDETQRVPCRDDLGRS